MRASSSNSTQSKTLRGLRSDRRWERYAECLVDHPALPLMAWGLLSAGRLVDSVGTRFRLLTRTLSTVSKGIIRLAFPLTPDRVLIESYRRLIRRELLDRLSDD